MKKRLIDLLCSKSFQYSEKETFKLASGAMSKFYVNCKPVTLSPEGMYLVGNLVFESIKGFNVSGVGGLTFGADPIAVATSFVSYLQKSPVKAFSIRKEQKDHGMIKWVEGDMAVGDKVVIIEDVVTTGGSTIKAVERARVQGLDVVHVITLVDRQEGGIENIKKYIESVSAIITRDELMDCWQKKE
ncbi:Orotate phosphoribosyltransferase [Desulfamplus magnetovallimortis]|uniref:Orotate phosphoribosyltransferase n=1 Tax=Desulfamplus magnetovallimortis TaxID=1246637 RepID=A0A1W1HIY4_9BACT|nr:orotate phosphoribosyltransferase [Desulfamplus magnetovallimortis]SLM32318.1 Orotate phosphoribosyltransferase [Desulfamplus magnetovallimortis]